MKPNIQLFKVKLKQKYQTELYLARKNATLDNFNQQWLFNPLANFEGVSVAKCIFCLSCPVPLEFSVINFA